MWQKLSHGEFMDKAKAVVVGHAVGDAVGVPYEFNDHEYMARHPATDMVGYGTYGMPKGSWSDDTSMSLCELDAIARAGGDEIKLHNYTLANFRAWLSPEAQFTPTGVVFDVGGTCNIAIAQGYGETGENSNGNGSLMRIHPYVLKNFYDINNKDGQLSPEDISRYLKVIAYGSKMTHAHPRSVLACLLYAGILTKLLVCPQKSSVQEGLNAAVEAIKADEEIYDFVRDELNSTDPKNSYVRILRGIKDEPRKTIYSGGYVVETFEAVVWCILNTDNYRDCVLKAVNLGHDTDTVAAIAGGLAGALYGYDAIPEEWRNSLLKRDFIESLCERAFPA